MLQFIKDRLAAIWQDRFRHGVGISFGSLGVTRYTNGLVLAGNGPVVMSIGTGHWPWHLCEFGLALGAVPSWHMGVLGFTVGMIICHDHNEDGSLKGVDYKKYYWFFKGLNHQGKDLEEII